MTNKEMMKRLEVGEDVLVLSIQKWVDIVEGKGINEGIENCALCELYLNKPRQCEGCPIFDSTGYISCHGTAYSLFCTHVSLCNDCLNVIGGYCEGALELAKQEVKFLQELKTHVEEGGNEE